MSDTYERGMAVRRDVLGDAHVDRAEAGKTDLTRRNGLSSSEIGEVILQSAIYCGVPAANHAFGVATQVLEPGQGQR